MIQRKLRKMIIPSYLDFKNHEGSIITKPYQRSRESVASIVVNKQFPDELHARIFRDLFLSQGLYDTKVF
jgi:hypothetical protein